MSRTPPEVFLPSDIEREEIPFDVLFVGGGPASLAGAIRLSQLCTENNVEAEIGVIEKGAELGDHAISGAVLNTMALGQSSLAGWVGLGRNLPF